MNAIASRISLPITAVALAFFANAIRASDIEQKPIEYSKGVPRNAVSELEARLGRGESLPHTAGQGYLKAVLKELGVPESSQTLVFSRTSLQRDRIGPAMPRAIYFNDDVYVGFCQRGEVLEVSASDSGLGTVYYTVSQDPSKPLRFKRQTDSCLICHASSISYGNPGHLVRSVFTDRTGNPILSLGSKRVSHETSFEERWGGWYVTGTSGKMTHRGNQILTENQHDEPEGNPQGVNRTDLKSFFSASHYLTPHSDMIALMVLEHQTEAHNRITRASFETRQALYRQRDMDRILNEKRDGLSESSQRCIQSACEPLVRYLLFCEEAKWDQPIAGTSDFAKEFAARGPFDGRRRSFREFDLETHLFRYPCSYLIYSAAFDGLPAEAKHYVASRFDAILAGRETDKVFQHLTEEKRRAIREILNETKKGFLP